MACKSRSSGVSHDPADWPARHKPAVLEPGEIHLWAACLELAPGEQAVLLPLLSEDEQARSRRLASVAARERFAAARAVLRLLLGAYAGVAPESLTFGTADGGKPFLAGRPELRFSLSHSKALALIAIARDIELGVDVERRRHVPDATALAERYFAPEEAGALAALPATEQSDAFLRCWTLKEALLKATGEGLSRALDSFQVTIAPEEPGHLVALAGPAGPPDAWTLLELAPATDYLGALAVKTPPRRVRRFTRRVAG